MFDRLIPLLIIFVASLFFDAGIDAILKITACILLIYILYDKSISFDSGDVLLAIGTFTYHLFCGDKIYTTLYYSIGYVVVYQLGKKVATVGRYMPESKAGWLAVLAGFAMMIKGFLHYSVRPADATEEWIGWGKTTPDARTHFEMYLVVMAALLGYFILITFNKLIICGLIGIVLSLICVYLGVISEGRFAIGCCLCSMVTVFVIYFLEKRLYKEKNGKIIMAVVIGLIILSPFVYIFDLFGYRTFFDNSYMAGSGGFFTNTRFSLMLQQIELFRYYPLGRCEVPLVEYNGTETDFAHNFWIDTGRTAGIIPAVLYVGFSITNIISLMKVSYYSKNINRYALIASFVGVMLLFGFQPTNGFNEFWCYLILLGGLLKGIATGLNKDVTNYKTAILRVRLDWR